MSISSRMIAQEEIAYFQDFPTKHNLMDSSDISLVEADFTLIEEQLSKAKRFLFKEHLDSAKLIIGQLVQELSTKKILDSSQGLEAQFLQAVYSN